MTETEGMQVPRPSRCRRVCESPAYDSFAPAGVPAGGTVRLTLDEYEAIRLIDLEGLTHEETALRMEISRTTVTDVDKEAHTVTAAISPNTSTQLTLFLGNTFYSLLCFGNISGGFVGKFYSYRIPYIFNTNMIRSSLLQSFQASNCLFTATAFCNLPCTTHIIQQTSSIIYTVVTEEQTNTAFAHIGDICLNKTIGNAGRTSISKNSFAISCTIWASSKDCISIFTLTIGKGQAIRIGIIGLLAPTASFHLVGEGYHVVSMLVLL